MDAKMHYQNMINHYNQILNTKPVVCTFSDTFLGTKNNFKHIKAMNQERVKNNQILLKKLIKIRLKSKTSFDNNNPNVPLRRKSLRSDFRLKQKEEKIIKENQNLYQRLRYSRPYVGSVESWNVHHNQFLKKEKMLETKQPLKSALQFQSQIYSTFRLLSKSHLKHELKMRSQHNNSNLEKLIGFDVKYQHSPPSKVYKYKKKKGKKSCKTQILEKLDNPEHIIQKELTQEAE